MISNKFKKQENTMNPLAVAVTGAVVGAGVAIAGAMALKDEKNRKKVKDVLLNAKDQASSYIETMKSESKDKKAEVTEKVTKVIDAKKKEVN
jgi:gas vesicle protein